MRSETRCANGFYTEQIVTKTYFHLFAFLGLATLAANPSWAATVSGASAFAFTKHAVEFGPRPPGSAANKALQAYILAELHKNNCAAAH